MKRYFVLLALFLPLSGMRAEKLVRVKGLTRSEVRELLTSYPRSAVQMRRGDTYDLLLEDDAIRALSQKGRQVEVLLDMEKWREEVRKWAPKSEYHTYSEFVQDFVNLAQSYPSITRLDTIGFSVQGRAILALKVSDNVNVKEPEPEVRIVGVHHGNEWISAEIPILFAHYLVENYGSDPDVTEMVNEREIWIIPIFNPDGHVVQTRYNANSVDLNRDYGYMWENWGSSPSPYSQPETQAMFEFSQKHNFTLSLSYHSYGEIVNYIWNYSPNEPPDSPMVRQYSNGYASFNGYWVTEGYDWYETHGDLNDYSYGIDADVDWTIELGNEFIPPASQIDPIFNENKGAIMYILKKAGHGIGGFLIDSTTGDTVKEYRVYVEGNDWPVFSDRELGDFVRDLLPGTYNLRFEANGYAPVEVSGVTVYDDSLTRITVYTHPQDGVYGYKYVWADIADPNNSFANDMMTPRGLGAPDGQYISLGVGGEVVVDMGQYSWVHEGFTIYEGNDGNANEGYTVAVSDNWNGPWHSLGTGYGTMGFSIASSGLDSVRYIKITDDGDGSANAATAGFDLDAIVAGPPQYPDIDVSPLSIDVTLQPGEVDTQEILISNEGEAPLVFSVGDVENNRITAGPSSNGVLYVPKAEPPKGAPDPGRGIPPQKGQGGPDNFGYMWIDSDEPGGPIYDWVEISGVGTPLNFGDDDSLTVSLPFSFDFYGNTKNSVKIASNGYLTFGADGADYSNDPIPDPDDPNDFIAPFWDDLNPLASGEVYYYNDEANDRFIVEWYQVPHYYNSGSYTFEAILYPDGEILFQYQNMNGELASATIGIENSNASDGLQVVYNASYVHNNLALLITTNQGWLSEDPRSGFLDPGESTVVNAIIDATDLENGVYTADIIILSNDPDEDSIVIPVTLTVGISYIAGDANGDGEVNSADLAYLANFLFGGGPSPDPMLAGDANGDCEVTTVDLVYLANYLFNGGPPPQYCNGRPSAKKTRSDAR